MKLRNLKGSIRKTSRVRLAFASPKGQMLLNLVKQDLIDTLDTLYGEGNVETGLMVTPAGLLAVEGADAPEVNAAGNVDWGPAVAAAAARIEHLVARPLLTNDGKVLVSGELQDVANNLRKLAGGEAPTDEIDIDALLDFGPESDPEEMDIEDLLG